MVKKEKPCNCWVMNSIFLNSMSFLSWQANSILGTIGSGSASHTPTIYVDGEGHITGRGYNGGSSFHGDNGEDYSYDGSRWHRS